MKAATPAKKLERCSAQAVEIWEVENDLSDTVEGFKEDQKFLGEDCTKKTTFPEENVGQPTPKPAALADTIDVLSGDEVNEIVLRDELANANLAAQAGQVEARSPKMGTGSEREIRAVLVPVTTNLFGLIALLRSASPTARWNLEGDSRLRQDGIWWVPPGPV